MNNFCMLFLGCYSLPTDMDRGYPEFGYYLNRTGRPMLYSCSWPVYQTYSGMTVRLLFLLSNMPNSNYVSTIVQSYKNFVKSWHNLS